MFRRNQNSLVQWSQVKTKYPGVPGGPEVKNPALSLVWHGFNLLLGNLHMTGVQPKINYQKNKRGMGGKEKIRKRSRKTNKQ